MALEKTITTKHGIEITNAYFRVGEIRLIGKSRIEFNVYVHADPSKPFVSESIEDASYDLNGGNPIQQAYEHLKTLPEFEGAVDC
jgi:hypothetical protein